MAAEVVDETLERTAAQAALTTAADHGFALERRDEYLTESRFPDFDTWVHDVVGIDPDRAAAMAHHRDHARANFERIAERHDSLTPQERRAAATLLEHLDDLATYRAAADDEVLRCEECGRVLVRTSESGL